MAKKITAIAVVVILLFVGSVGTVFAGTWSLYEFTMSDLFKNGFTVSEHTSALVYQDAGSWYETVNADGFYGSSGLSWWIPNDTPKGANTIQVQMENVGYKLSAGDVFEFKTQLEVLLYEKLGMNPTVRIGFFTRYEDEDGGTLKELVFSKDYKPTYSGDRYRQQVNIAYTANSDVFINHIVVLIKFNREVTGTGTAGRARLYFKSLTVAYGDKGEQQYAEEQGDSKADALLGALPEQDTEQAVEGLETFTGAISTTSTDAKWKLPAIKLPAIAGIMPEIKLTDEMDIDFGAWVQKIPKTVMTVVQYVLTLALIYFCFKELYKLISYVLTLRGGGGE